MLGAGAKVVNTRFTTSPRQARRAFVQVKSILLDMKSPQAIPTGLPSTPEELTRGPVRVCLVAMSGVGKTHMARKLPHGQWFHYSGDYRIGTRYLADDIGDYLKALAIRDSTLKALLASDSIYVNHNITFANLNALSAYLGMVGCEVAGGLPTAEFRKRQAKFRSAEIAAMADVPRFVKRAQTLYGYPNFVNDAGGSLCEIFREPTVAPAISGPAAGFLVHIAEPDSLIDILRARAESDPKPMYYDPAFFEAAFADFCVEQDHADPDVIPRAFFAWVFDRLIAHRRNLYREMASLPNGITVPMEKAQAVQDEADFLNLLWSGVTDRRAGMSTAG